MNIRDYHVVYSSPSVTDKGAMPIGNGELGASVFATGRELSVCLSRTDALTEADRNVKLGIVRFRFSPNVLAFENFRQELVPECGEIVFSLSDDAGRRAEIRVFADRCADDLRVGVYGNFPIEATAEFFTWRDRENRSFNELGMDQTALAGVTESADRVRKIGDAVLFWHENRDSVVRHTAELEGLGDCLDLIPDRIKGRVFGGVLRTFSVRKISSCAKADSVLTVCAEFCVHTFSEIPEDREALFERVLRESETPEPFATAERRTAAFWTGFFQRSYIYVRNDSPAALRTADGYCVGRYENPEVNGTESEVTRAYLLTKYMQKCCTGGSLPIRFNGGHFNPANGIRFGDSSMPDSIGAKPPEPFELGRSPDERSWGNMLLWQNERLPYYAILAQNECADIKKFLEFYTSFSEINRVKAKRYYGAEGEYNTEIMTSFGLSPNYLYGYDRIGRADGWVENRFGGAVDLSPGLELSRFMLEYYLFSNDTAFLKDRAIPFIRALFRCVETRFRNRSEGKLVLSPLNSIETYRDTCNPVTVVAGLRSVLDLLERIPMEEETRNYFLAYRSQVPELTFENSEFGRVLAPAGIYERTRYNVESPELYAVFPFENAELDRETAERTYRRALAVSGNAREMRMGEPSSAPGFCGWHYEGIVAAMLGLTEETRRMLEYNCAFKHVNARFPAMWGPAYDSLPDTDHGANIMNLLQKMVMKSDGTEVRLLPAFPEEWDVSFKLWVDAESFVEFERENGIVKRCFCNNPKYRLTI